MTLPLNGNIAASRQLPYIYVNNWKCGCSTIRRTLWASEHALGVAPAPLDPHAVEWLSPFVNDPRRWENVDNEFVFTFVRNPYARVLSAYLDKITGTRDHAVWGPFAQRHRLGEDEISFVEFLRLIATERPETMDMHWRPQSQIIGADLVPYNFVGTMETFTADFAHVIHTLFGPDATIEVFAPHRTQASERLRQYYGAEERAIVEDLYRDDFAALGYAADLSQLERVRTAWPPVDASALRAWGRANRLVDEGRFVEAAAAIEPVQDRLNAPVVHNMLLRCYRELTQSNDFADPQLVSNLQKLHRLSPVGPDTWKGYSSQLRAAGRIEASIESEIQAATLCAGESKRSAKRCRKLRRRLAMLRAQQSRRAEALAALRPTAAERDPGLVGTVRGAMDVAAIHLVATAAPFLAALRRQPSSGKGRQLTLDATASAGTAHPGDR